jgi:beta-aspartyl-dipeptidase (metallo-type)
MLGNVPGLVHLHAGDGTSGLGPIFDVLEETEIPPAQFLPTHVGRNQDLLNQGIELVRRGGFIDLTCPGDPRNETQALVSLVETLLEGGIPLSHVTLSSDSNGSLPEFDEDGNLVEMSRAKIGSILQTFSELVRKELLPLPEALSLVTKNPARRLGVFPRKGSIAEGRDADLVVLGEKLEPEVAFAGGELLLKEKETLVEGPYE